VAIRVRAISDVRGDVDGLERVAGGCDRLIVLGDLTGPHQESGPGRRELGRVLAALPPGALLAADDAGQATRPAPEGARRVGDAEIVSVGAWTFGFANGSGASLERLGPVEVVCTRVPPRLPAYTYDVVGRTFMDGSSGLVGYLRRHAPRFALFGHVRSPLMPRGTIGTTELVNVAHLFAVGTAFDLDVPE
jgi:hypothetical protein